MLTFAIALSKIGKIEFKYYAIFTHFFLNIKPMKGTFCTNNLQIKNKYTVYHPDRKRLAFDEYILFEGQSSYNRMRFYICLIHDDSIVTGHLRNG